MITTAIGIATLVAYAAMGLYYLAKIRSERLRRRRESEDVAEDLEGTDE